MALSHFLGQSHFVVRAIDSFVYKEKEVEKVPLKRCFICDGTHFETNDVGALIKPGKEFGVEKI